MNILQKHSLEVEKDGKLIQLVVDNDMPLGLLFDAVMEIKGYLVDRMTEAHKEEAEAAAEAMGDNVEEEKEDGIDS
jgi:hypothetical protein